MKEVESFRREVLVKGNCLSGALCSATSTCLVTSLRASRVKLQRLEKETRELEAARESLRHAQAKVKELEKTQKRLLEQKNASQKETVRLKEELQAVKAKVRSVGSLLSSQRSQCGMACS